LKQAIALITQVHPDVVILDLTLPDYDGLDGLVELRRHFPDLRVVILSMHAEEKFALASLRAIGKRLMVVQEDTKFEPLLAAIAGGLCTHLVIGAHMAERLLQHAGEAEKKAS